MKNESNTEELEIASEITEDLMSYLRNKAQERGTDSTHQICIILLRNMIAQYVYDSLVNPNAKKGEDIDDASYRSFIELKDDIQDAVSNGFEVAFNEFNPDQDATYFCDIYPIGEPINKIVV